MLIMRNFEMLPTEENVFSTFCNNVLGRNEDVKYFYEMLMSYDFSATHVEHLTCTTGCVGGAGQPIGRKEQKYVRAKGLYEADRKTLIKSSQHDPILKTLYEKLPPEKAHELLHVHYPQPE